MFVMVIAVMSIMMGVAVQSVSFQQQRVKEAELIFRGGQYVEAIRLYKARFGRNPMRLKEIWEADPKVIRRKFKDPITDSESWGIIFVGQEGRQGQVPGGLQPTGTPVFGSQGQGSGGPGTDSGLPPGVQRDENGEVFGPIAGVHSTSCDSSIRVYEGRTTYCEWRFVYQDDPRRRGGGNRGGGNPNPTQGPYHGGDDGPRDRGGSSDPRNRGSSDDGRDPGPRYTPQPRRTGTPTY